MQSLSFDAFSQNDIPPAIFPEEAMPSPVISHTEAPKETFSDVQHIKKMGVPQSRALRIVRAKSGETELRLLVEHDDGNGTQFVIVSSTIAPYVSKREVLVKRGKKKSPLNKEQAIEEFELRVESAYPPEVLRNQKIVAIHLNIL